MHWQITVKLFPAVAWKTEIVIDEFGRLANIYKQSVKRVAWFILDTHSKIKVEKNKLRQELFNKKGPELNNSGNSKPNHMAKDAKIHKFAVKKMCCREKAGSDSTNL